MRKIRVFALLSCLLAIPALAQPVRQAACPQGGCNLTQPSGGDILYSQLDDPSGYVFVDQQFEAIYAVYDAEGADDFVVDDSAGWNVTILSTPGIQSAGGVPFFTNHFFYADAGGVPGAPLDGCQYPAHTDFVHDAGNLTIAVDCDIFEGAAWFSQQVRQDFSVSAQHFWATRSSAANTPALFRNPGNGFGSDCLDWGPANSVCGMTGADYRFELAGNPASIGDPCLGSNCPVPAAGPFGTFLIGLTLAGASGWLLRRRR